MSPWEGYVNQRSCDRGLKGGEAVIGYHSPLIPGYTSLQYSVSHTSSTCVQPQTKRYPSAHPVLLLNSAFTLPVTHLPPWAGQTIWRITAPSCGHSCLSQTIQESFLNILQYKFLDTHTNYWIYRSLYNPRCQTRGSGDFLHEWCPFILSSCCFPDVCFSTLLMNMPSSSQVPVLALIPVGNYFSCGIAHPVAPADHESHCILYLPVSHLLFVFNLLGHVFYICSLHTITARTLYHRPWNLWSFTKLT
ncbi:uncharacterized protein [Dendrobates tinctorius]|uniref:uncharacterized protein isoform X1 n=1 Tax=Dendrobates tinctorius TaxID=92724 RepID=UPI003CC9C99B